MSIHTYIHACMHTYIHTYIPPPWFAMQPPWSDLSNGWLRLAKAAMSFESSGERESNIKSGVSGTTVTLQGGRITFDDKEKIQMPNRHYINEHLRGNFFWQAHSLKIKEIHVRKKKSQNGCGSVKTAADIQKYTYIHTCMHTYIHTYIHTHIHTYVRTYIHTRKKKRNRGTKTAADT